MPSDVHSNRLRPSQEIITIQANCGDLDGMRLEIWGLGIRVGGGKFRDFEDGGRMDSAKERLGFFSKRNLEVNRLWYHTSF